MKHKYSSVDRFSTALSLDEEGSLVTQQDPAVGFLSVCMTGCVWGALGSEESVCEAH